MTDNKLKELLKTEKTPLYVFDMKELRRRVNFLKESLPDRVELCYAVKANTFILKPLEGVVDLFEICSPGEYRICEKAGLAHKKYVISGVNKEEGFIESIVGSENRIGYFTAESVNQFNLLRKSAEKAGRKITVLLRLTGGNQFGLDREEVSALIEKYKEDTWSEIAGIQYFTGTQKTSLKKLRREIEYLDQFIEELYEKYGFCAKKLEYGPGFPVSYFEGEEFDETAFLEEFSKMLEGMRYSGQITLELGRSIAASCGTYLTGVVDTKRNNGELYAIVDGGMHQIVYYGQSMAMKHPKIRLLTDSAEKEEQSWNICGSLCTVNDFLVKRFPLPKLKPGDTLAFENTGAYCITEGISLFLSRELPSVVLSDGEGNFTTVRKQIQTEIFNA